MVPSNGATSNSEERPNPSSIFVSADDTRRTDTPDLVCLDSALEVLAEWDEHLTKVGVSIDDLEPRP